MLNGEGTPLIYIAPKLNAPLSENFRLGVGGAYATVPGSGGGGFGLLYGVGTLGNRDRNATIGLGYAVSEEILATSPLIAFSGMLRVSRRLSLITENWILPGETDIPGLFSLGFRIMGQDIAGDIAFLIFPSEFELNAPLSENFRLGVGGAYATVPGSGGGGFGLLYGVGTLGNRDRNATIGLGYAVSEEILATSPLIAFSGMLRVSRRLSLITENWILPGETDIPGLFSLGFRIMGQDIAGDIAFLIFPSEFETVVIPYLSLAVKF